MKHLMPIAAALLLAACATKPEPAPLPGPTAGLGEAGQVNGLRFRPIQVLEDSRCPTRVQCVWAGRFRLLLGVGKPGGGESTRIEMTLGEPISVYGGMLTLVNVDPPKGAAGSLEPDAYRMTFTYTR